MARSCRNLHSARHIKMGFYGRLRKVFLRGRFENVLFNIIRRMKLKSKEAFEASLAFEDEIFCNSLAVGECSSAYRPRNITQLPPSLSPCPPPNPARLRFPRLTSLQQSASPYVEQMYTGGDREGPVMAVHHQSSYQPSASASPSNTQYTTFQHAAFLIFFLLLLKIHP